jgi:hypothetical protein
MASQVRRHRVAILSDQHARFSLAPAEDGRVIRPKREVWRVAYAHGVDGISATQIVAKDCLPQWSAKMLVEQKRDGHALARVLFGQGHGTGNGRQAIAEGMQIERRRG